jgi:cystathionine beta-synthase
MVLADPAGSVLVEFLKSGKIAQAGSWLVEGIGEDFVPPVCDLSRVKKAYSIPDKEAFLTCRELLMKEGISKVYNDYWMIDQGFIERETYGDLRDLIARRHREHAVATVNADETVLAAHQRMKLYDVSQLPVLKDGKIVGIVDEEDILMEVVDNPGHFREPVTEAMESRLVTVPPGASIAQLLEIFKRGLVAIVVDGEEFLGLITRIDLLNWLRRRAQQ